MKFLKGIFKGVKDKILSPLGRFAKRNKKALITAAVLAGMIYTGGALAGLGGRHMGNYFWYFSQQAAAGTGLYGFFGAGAGAGGATAVGATAKAGLVGPAQTFAYGSTASGIGSTLLGTGATTGIGEVAALGEEDYGPIGRGPANRLVPGRNRGFGYA